MLLLYALSLNASGTQLYGPHARNKVTERMVYAEASNDSENRGGGGGNQEMQEWPGRIENHSSISARSISSCSHWEQRTSCISHLVNGSSSIHLSINSDSPACGLG